MGSYGRETVREVGDFVAHFGERDRGVSTDLVANFFVIIRFLVPVWEQRRINPFSPLLPIPGVNIELLDAMYTSIDKKLVKQQTKLKPSVATRVFKSLKAKVEKIMGTSESRQLDAQEVALLNCLLSHITIRPAFDDERLFKEFAEVLAKHKLLREGERVALLKKKPLISLYAVSCMHLSRVALKHGVHADIFADKAGGTINVLARVPSPKRGIYFARPLFSTSLPAADWCEPELLEGDDQTKWNYAIELGPDHKLRKLEGAQLSTSS
jgi:hypothetical protein